MKRYTIETVEERSYGSKTTREPNIPLIARDCSIAVGAVIAVALFNPFHTVPTGYRGVVTQFGAVQGIHAEGLAILPPWQKMNLFNIRAEEAKVENATGATADTQPVEIDLTIRYNVMPDKVSHVFEYYSRNGDLSSFVTTAAQEVVKAVSSQYTAPDLVAKRAEVSMKINDALRKRVSTFGANVISVDMRNFDFSKVYMAAIEQKTTQEQLKHAEANKAETVREQERQKVIIAEAARDSAKARADGEAYALLKIATAQADSLKIQNAALAQNKDVLELRRIEVEQTKANRWNGVQPPQNIFGTAPLPYMNFQK